MPFRVIKDNGGFYVENIETGKRFSKKPLTEAKAKKQFRILDKYLGTLEGSGLNRGELREIRQEALTDLDIKKYVPDAKIISSSDLKKYNSIDRVLPNQKDCVFIIYESKPNYGHWCLLSKYEPDVIEYFDSYGGQPDAPLKWVNRAKQEELDLKPYLSSLLEKAKSEGCDIIYSSKHFQKNSSKKLGKIASCGRHCIFRALCILNDGQGLSDYIKMMNMIKEITGYSYDDIVSGIISI
jgi:hypothetical protein